VPLCIVGFFYNVIYHGTIDARIKGRIQVPPTSQALMLLPLALVDWKVPPEERAFENKSLKHSRSRPIRTDRPTSSSYMNDDGFITSHSTAIDHLLKSQSLQIRSDVYKNQP
jgi:hypothetical protein